MPSASEHVGRNRRDPIVISGTCSTFDELHEAHDAACSVKAAFPYTNKKTGKITARKRSVRADSHTLYTAIVSLPVTSAEALGDPTKMAECRKAFGLAVTFEKQRLEDAGGEFAMGVVHLDETHVHLHIYGLDRQRGSVNGLHPGKAALDAFRERHGALSRKGSDLFQRSKRAYCDAMREWQDDLHRDVFGKVGLCRFGPRRSRLSRAQYTARKREEEERARAQETLGNLRETVTGLRATSDTLAAREDHVIEAEKLLDAGRVKLEQQRASVTEKEQRVDAGLATIEAMAEGYLEEHEEHEGSRISSTTKAKNADGRWKELRARLTKAPDEVARLGSMMGTSLRRLRRETAEQSRAGAMTQARAEIEERFPGLGAVHAFARTLVARLRTPEERQEALKALDHAALVEAREVIRFRRPEKSAAPGDVPPEL